MYGNHGSSLPESAVRLSIEQRSEAVSPAWSGNVWRFVHYLLLLLFWAMVAISRS